MNTDEYYLDIAEAVSKKSTCLKKQWGAVIVKNNEIISTGYNGAPRKIEDCVSRGYCLREKSRRNADYCSCLSVHAEMNAIISAARRDLIGSTLYLAGVDTTNEYVKNPDCCVLCKRLIKNAGIEKVIIRVMPNVWETKYPENWDTPDVFYTKGET